MKSNCLSHFHSHGILFFYRVKSDGQEDDDDDSGGDGPPFKKGPSVKPGSTGGDFEPGQCNRLEKMVMAERRKKNPKAPSLICNSRMRKIAKLHAQNLLNDGFAGLVR